MHIVFFTSINKKKLKLQSKLFLHLKASVDLYTIGQGTKALLHLYEFSCTKLPSESNSVHRFPTIFLVDFTKGIFFLIKYK